MNYIKIESSSLSNGTGWRVVLWLSGCAHRCPGCHNPETWDPACGKWFGENELNRVIELMSKPYIQGLTITGGDPLFPANRQALLDTVKKIKEELPGKDIWLYTGYDFEEISELEILKYIDTVVDGKYVEELRDVTIPFRGSSNQRIINL